MIGAMAMALGMGVLGSAHCVGMCGGIATAATLRRPRLPMAPAPRAPLWVMARLHLGRLGGYAAAGLVAGGLGTLVDREFASTGRLVLRVLGLVVLLFTALPMLGLIPRRFSVERATGALGRALSPLRSRAMRRHEGAIADLALGALWGTLPCGMVYAAIALALGAAHPLEGALVMLAFGLGTSPALLALQWTASRLRHVARARAPRLALGAFMLCMATWEASQLLRDPACCPPSALAGAATSPTGR